MGRQIIDFKPDTGILGDTIESFIEKTNAMFAELYASVGTATPGGSTTQIQFNDAGSLGGDADLAYNKTTNTLTIGSVAAPGIIKGADGSASNGAKASLKGGAANGTNKNGGGVDITGGALTGSGSPGPITLTCGTDIFAMVGDGNLELDCNQPVNAGLLVFNANNSAVAESGAQAAVLSSAGLMEIGIANGTFVGASQNFANATCPFAWCATFSNYPLLLGAGNGGEVSAFLQHNNLVQTNLAAYATNRTDGFTYFAKSAGVPTGVPAHLTGNYANALPLTLDSTNHRLYYYNGGWKNFADYMVAPKILEGSNARMGVATLVGGTLVVGTTAVAATSRIFLTAQSLGTVTVPSALAVSARVVGTSFTILASAANDTSVVAWKIIEPA